MIKAVPAWTYCMWPVGSHHVIGNKTLEHLNNNNITRCKGSN